MLTVGFLILAACAPEPTPTVAPTPTPTPDLSSVLSQAGKKLAGMGTARFRMIDEMGSGAKFFGLTLKSVEGEIRTPDRFVLVVDAEAPGLGFVEIEMRGVGDQAYMKFFEDAPWTSLPIEQVPFNFGWMGVTLSELLPVIRGPAITGWESLGGAGAIRVEGGIVSDDLSNLITSVDPGHPITLTFWFDESSHDVRQLRIAGKLYDDDAPETTRLVIIEDINIPVDIQLPEMAPGP